MFTYYNYYGVLSATCTCVHVFVYMYILVSIIPVHVHWMLAMLHDLCGKVTMGTPP